jgi:hypothetical protein
VQEADGIQRVLYLNQVGHNNRAKKRTKQAVLREQGTSRSRDAQSGAKEARPQAQRASKCALQTWPMGGITCRSRSTSVELHTVCILVCPKFSNERVSDEAASFRPWRGQLSAARA